MHDDDYTREERELFERLPRESELAALEEDRLVHRLRAEGLLRPPRRSPGWLALAAALIVGVLVGWYAASSRSLEGQLERRSLTSVEAAALFERARGAYARARDRYVSATGVESPAQDPSSADRPGPEPVRTAGVLWF